MNHMSNLSYSRTNHLMEYLSTFTHKKRHSDPAILKGVMDDFKLRGIDPQKASYHDISGSIRSFCKRYGGCDEYFKKYKIEWNDIIPYYEQIKGVNIKLTPEQEQELKNRFNEISCAYEKVKSPERCNTLSYSYTVHKLFKITGMNHHSNVCRTLLAPDKIHYFEDMWNKITYELEHSNSNYEWDGNNQINQNNIHVVQNDLNI